MNTISSILSQSQSMPWLATAPWILTLIIIWTLIWKGLALWKAARLSHKWWFIILLVVNTVGILEIIYIFFVARRYTIETEKPTESTAA